MPGSGKSYLVEHMKIADVFFMSETQFYKQCLEINWKSKVLKLLKNFLCDGKIWLCICIYACEKLKSIRIGIKKTVEIIKYMVLFENIIKKNKYEDMVVFDQGIIQYIWSICLSSNEKMRESNLLNNILDEIQRKYKLQIIYYRIDYEIAAKRTKLREKKCFTDYLKQDEVSALYKKHCEDYKIFEKYIDKENIHIIENEVELKKVLCTIKNGGKDEKRKN